MSLDPTSLIGPGTLKWGLKGLEKLGVGDFGGTISELEQFSNGPLWTKHRVDSAQDKISELWDDHKDDVEDFLDDVGDTISDGLEFASDFFGSLFS